MKKQVRDRDREDEIEENTEGRARQGQPEVSSKLKPCSRLKENQGDAEEF